MAMLVGSVSSQVSTACPNSAACASVQRRQCEQTVCDYV